MRKTMRAIAAAMLVGSGATLAAIAYPERPVRLIVPSPPGGGADTVARILAPRLSDILGQQVVIDNRGGAGGTIGAVTAAHATADGYTLLAAIASQVTDAAILK